MKKRNIIIGVGVALLILFIVLVLAISLPKFGVSVYGDRGKNIVLPTNEEINKIKEDLTNIKGVKTISYQRKIKTINFMIDLETNYDKNSLNILLDKITNNLRDEVKKSVDIQVYFVTDDSKNHNYPQFFYKHHHKDVFSSATNNPPVEVEE